MHVNNSPTESASSSGTARGPGGNTTGITRQRSSASLHESGLSQVAVTPGSQETVLAEGQQPITRREAASTESGQGSSTEASETARHGYVDERGTTSSGTRLRHIENWRAAQGSVQGPAAEVQRLTEEFQNALAPLRTLTVQSKQQLRTNFSRIQPGSQFHPEVASQALADAVNQSLDIFESKRGDEAIHALEFAHALLAESWRVGGRFEPQHRQQLAERLKEMSPRGHQHDKLYAIRGHVLLHTDPVQDDPDAALRQHIARLDACMEVIFSAPFNVEEEPTFTARWRDACFILPMLDTEDQRTRVDQLTDQIQQYADEEDLHAPLLDSLATLLDTANKLQDSKCRSLVLGAAAAAVREADLALPATQVVLAMALAMSPTGSGAIAEPAEPQTLKEASQAICSLLESTFEHVVRKDYRLLHEPMFSHCMAAMESLQPADALSIGSRTQQMAVHCRASQGLMVSLARLSAQALRPLIADRANFRAQAEKLVQVLEQHLAAAPQVTSDNVHEHPVAKLFGEILHLGDEARAKLPDDSAWFEQIAQRVTALQQRTLPGLQAAAA